MKGGNVEREGGRKAGSWWEGWQRNGETERMLAGRGA